MEVQPQLILLQKTLLNIEGLGRDLYPQLDIWSTASPILREWMRERVSPLQILKSLRQQAPDLIEAARALPALVKSAVERARGGTLKMQIDAPAIQALEAEIRRNSRRRDAITIGSAILLGGLVWLGVGAGTAWPGWTLTLGGAIWLVVAWRR
jgi:ubiquinone biosynthesis protein